MGAVGIGRIQTGTFSHKEQPVTSERLKKEIAFLEFERPRMARWTDSDESLLRAYRELLTLREERDQWAVMSGAKSLVDCISDLAAANAQIQELQQGRCGMCNESPSNPVHSSGEGQHAFVTSEAEIMRLNAAVVHEAQRYAALEKRLEEMDAALREARSFIAVIECEEGLTTENLIAQIDAALVSEDGL